MISLYEQSDHVLNIFKAHQSYLNTEQLNTKINGSAIVVEPSVLNMIVEKLERDKYIFTYTTDGITYYCITIEGNLFVGYGKQLTIETSLASRKNIRDFALTWGTVLAGIAASALLVWQIYSYRHPAPIPVSVTLQGEKYSPKKN